MNQLKQLIDVAGSVDALQRRVLDLKLTAFDEFNSLPTDQQSKFLSAIEYNEKRNQTAESVWLKRVHAGLGELALMSYCSSAVTESQLSTTEDTENATDETPEAASNGIRGSNIPRTGHHDAGAFARCSYCGRYSDDPRSLEYNSRDPKESDLRCYCGKQRGWCGSFKSPTADSVWSG